MWLNPGDIEGNDRRRKGQGLRCGDRKLSAYSKETLESAYSWDSEKVGKKKIVDKGISVK